jgi:hypothetical protein
VVARAARAMTAARATTAAREVSRIGDNNDEKDSLTHFSSFALHRFMVLCSGKSNDDSKGKGGSGWVMTGGR